DYLDSFASDGSRGALASLAPGGGHRRRRSLYVDRPPLALGNYLIVTSGHPQGSRFLETGAIGFVGGRGSRRATTGGLDATTLIVVRSFFFRVDRRPGEGSSLGATLMSRSDNVLNQQLHRRRRFFNCWTVNDVS